ncbi:hypothetical protein L3073_06825 [Ancylomarina sp. DW003]|nr:hypothetical protein [Ancylomarina sp. DW003]MDE5421916.1 hypothetical protein [Ancylomarina sp. DW003]
MKFKKVIIVPGFISEGIFSSQVIPIYKYSKRKEKTCLVIQDNSPFHHLKDILDTEDVIKYSELKPVLRHTELVYVRDVFTFFKLFVLRILMSYKFEIFYDFRGLVFAESYMRNKRMLVRFLLKSMEGFVAKKADYLGAVSNNLKKFIKNEFTDRDVYVTPCCITNVNSSKVNVDDNIVKFVYLGGFSTWQCTDRIFSYYKSMETEIESSITIITQNKEEAIKSVSKFGIRNYSIKSLSQSEVLEELSNYHFGFLIREDDIVNKVASPVKFLEYTSNGVIPIITEFVGDYSDLIKENELGIIVNETTLEVDVIKQMLKKNDVREKLIRFSRNFQWDSYLKKHPFIAN